MFTSNKAFYVCLSLSLLSSGALRADDGSAQKAPAKVADAASINCATQLGEKINSDKVLARAEKLRKQIEGRRRFAKEQKRELTAKESEHEVNQILEYLRIAYCALKQNVSLSIAEDFFVPIVGTYASNPKNFEKLIKDFPTDAQKVLKEQREIQTELYMNGNDPGSDDAPKKATGKSGSG